MLTDHHQQTEEAIDCVIVLGVDNPEETTKQNLYQAVKDICTEQGLKYVILGDGKNPVPTDEIARLPKARNIIISTHGDIKNQHHTCTLGNPEPEISVDLIKKLQTQTGAGNIIFTACFAGKIIEELSNSKSRELQEGTQLFTPSPINDVTYSDNNQQIITAYLKQMQPGQAPSMISFVKDTIKTIPQTMVYAYQPEDSALGPTPIQSHTIRRTDRGIYHQAEAFCEYLLASFNDFMDQLVLTGDKLLLSKLEKELPHLFAEYHRNLNTENQIKLLQLNMNDKEKAQYHHSSLINHVRHNDVNIIDALLEKTQFSADLLYYAIATPYVTNLENMVKTILKHHANQPHGQDVNNFTTTQYHSNYTPLTLAIKCDKPETVKTLLLLGADIRNRDNGNRSPMSMICEKGATYNRICYELINEVNNTVKYLKLLPEEYKNQGDVAAILELSQLFSVKQTDIDLVKMKNTDAIKKLEVYLSVLSFLPLEKLLITAIQNKITPVINKALDQDSHLYRAIKSGNLNQLDNYFAAGLDINSANTDGNTLFHLAIKEGNHDLLGKLWNEGADIDKPNNKGFTPLHYMFMFSLENKELNNFFITNLAAYTTDINHQNITNNTALHMAANFCHEHGIHAILQRNADVNITNTYNETPLHLAAKHRSDNANVAQMLIKAGANIHLRDENGKTALEYAVEKANVQFAKTLLLTQLHQYQSTLQFSHQDSFSDRALLNDNLTEIKKLLSAANNIDQIKNVIEHTHSMNQVLSNKNNETKIHSGALLAQSHPLKVKEKKTETDNTKKPTL